MRTEYDYRGEDTEIELEAIRNIFAKCDKQIDNIEKVNDKERQIKGIDYIVNCCNRSFKIDTKIHYFDSDILVYEIDDKRPNYKGHSWGDPSSNKETDYLVWIIAAKNKAVIFNYRKLTSQFETFKNEWEHKDYMDTRWGTVNIWLPIDEIEKVGVISVDCSKLQTKPNFYSPARRKNQKK